MIGWLEGSILEKFDNNEIILVNKNIGYLIKILDIKKISHLGQYSFYINQIISENKNDLYGFKSLEELTIFKMLIKISGIGPATALIIMQNLSIKKIAESIKNSDVEIFINIKGIGPNTILRIKEALTKLNKGKIK